MGSAVLLIMLLSIFNVIPNIRDGMEVANIIAIGIANIIPIVLVSTHSVNNFRLFNIGFVCMQYLSLYTMRRILFIVELMTKPPNETVEKA